MSLALRNLIFTLIVPGAGAVYVPWLILTADGKNPEPIVLPAVVAIALGAALYFWCFWLFATVGGGKPGPWDTPRRVVEVGPLAWVRNTMYLSAVTVVAGESLLFLSPRLLVYLALFAMSVHLFVVGYEEPTLAKRFGDEYEAYQLRVPRWIPLRPRARAR